MTHPGPADPSGSEPTARTPLRPIPSPARGPRARGTAVRAVLLLAGLALVTGCRGTEAPPRESTNVLDSQGSGPSLPATETGYRVRLDGDASAPGEFLVRGAGPGGIVRVTTGPGGIAWRAEDTVSAGPFRAEATFLQRGAPVDYREAYGIFVGGEELDGPDQRYTYLLVRGTGEFTVRRRSGSGTETLLEWTGHPAVAGVEVEGAEPRNTLAVEADAEETRFVVNDAVVHRVSSEEAAPYGTAGLRVNHRLDLEVEAWALEPLDGAGPPPS